MDQKYDMDLETAISNLTLRVYDSQPSEGMIDTTRFGENSKNMETETKGFLYFHVKDRKLQCCHRVIPGRSRMWLGKKNLESSGEKKQDRPKGPRLVVDSFHLAMFTASYHQ
ncbi:hypothetical protein R1flu_020562 [Riccia fluitans]|uniref:Uncharacterized protein n=1 Tax=Riccia fluitans TaxID=41844 RepID=A0ABD1ZQC1_9MARC